MTVTVARYFEPSEAHVVRALVVAFQAADGPREGQAVAAGDAFAEGIDQGDHTIVKG